MRSFLTVLMLISLVALSARAQNDSATAAANNPNTQPSNNAITIDPNNRPSEPIKVQISADGADAGGMSPLLKDLIDAIAKLLGLVGIGIAAVVAINQFARNRELRQNELDERTSALEQRKNELQWKKAELAKTVLNEMWDDPYAVDAMSMLDWDSRDYDLKLTRAGLITVEKISSTDIWAALRVAEKHFNLKERYIRDCFDHFFGVMQILEHYITIDLIEFKDVTYPFAYYAALMNDTRKSYEYFIDAYHGRAGEFLKRFPEWAELEADEAEGPAYFMFDCPPGKERFIFMLDDPVRIKTARERVLSDEEELRVTGELVGQPVFYNEPWDFHIKPSSVDFVKSSYDLADIINKRVEMQLPREKAAFSDGAVWHFGGARLLAEIPSSSFSHERYLTRKAGIEKLKRQERVKSPGVK